MTPNPAHYQNSPSAGNPNAAPEQPDAFGVKGTRRHRGLGSPLSARAHDPYAHDQVDAPFNDRLDRKWTKWGTG